MEGTIKDFYMCSEYGTDCGAVRDVDRGSGIIAGVYGKDVLLWKE
jgi:hypothetical protein